MRFDIGTLDSGERSLPFGLLVFVLSCCGSFLCFGIHCPSLRKKKKYFPTDRPFSRVRGNKDIFKGGPDIAMQHQFSKLKAV